ncbi:MULTISPECIES: tRNA (adenosine(37)-N6)-dimethylallyltransferase MiaA [unclassified Guyparkeria]|uniref:tRNA (adenosine(37)-N6)-dimethylallyltransferase MiaA n=1 Tax=unclassified Guyparkeria TaxID=2626246 RepID=UPI00073385A9|nr:MULTISPECIES: tRNA (adenosine(37)-N6)-dimethylallyltransferase MiaA [unclassified Guyparkeria]KTG17404.1 tRNA dimethylallyltransferase [Guyparkeria sp. XI15]OAE87381.1 tRNA dimethylallyltransferase [Guyparkeria sp. WRN-7]
MTDAASQRLPIVAIAGPTASGKTALAMRLADRLPVSIISVDSVMIYRGMDIGSAKPSPELLARYPHALVDICDPAEAYSVERFSRDVLEAIGAARSAGRVPLLVGGTMMYFQALLRGLSRLPPTEPAVREAVREEAGRVGWPAMHAELAKVDPEAAARIHATDPQRIGRALEVHRATGQSLTEWQRLHPPVSPLAGERVLAIALWPRSTAHTRQAVAQRFDAMLAAGFLDEVEALYRRGDLHAGMPSVRAVGYRQAWSYLAGETDRATMRERAITATRQLAKRQRTWLRGAKEWQAMDAEAPDRVEERILNFVETGRS